MKKLFIQFYLLLLACFLVMTMLVGLIYRYTAERAGRESMDDMIKSSLYLIRNELRDTAPRNWNKTIENFDFNLSFKLHIVPLDHYQHQLDPGNLKHLQNGEIVALDNKYTIIQRIPHSQYVLAVGPIPYLFYLHEMRIFDILLMLFVGVSLALPVFIWMRPHWENLLRLENAAQRFGQGHLDERIHFDNISSLARLGVAFNQMADNINALVTSKKQLIDGIAHEFRTPLVRLHYRLEMSENLSEAELKALILDIGQLEALIEELLTCARLDRPRVDLNFQEIDLAGWLAEKLANFRLINPGYQIIQNTPQRMNVGVVDCRLMERVLDNLVNNALRYASQRLRVGLWFDVDQAFLQVEDDGPGIPPEDRQRVFEPFVRLDPSRDRATGGCGLGLAIVRSVAQAFGGQVIIGNSPLGGACVRFCWPLDLPLRQSSVHISH